MLVLIFKHKQASTALTQYLFPFIAVDISGELCARGVVCGSQEETELVFLGQVQYLVEPKNRQKLQLKIQSKSRNNVLLCSEIGRYVDMTFLKFVIRPLRC